MFLFNSNKIISTLVTMTLEVVGMSFVKKLAFLLKWNRI